MSRSLRLATNLARHYPWVTTPFIVSAPMRVMSSPSLAVAVSNAGGLGFLGPGVKTQDIHKDLEEISTLLKTNTASANTNSESLPVGVGFQLWSDDVTVGIAAIERYKPCAAWLYAPHNTDTDYDHWARQIRRVSPHTHIWIQVGSLAEATALLSASEKPDVVVVQGAESGGHGRETDGLGLITLFPEVADAYADSGIPLFAAGGIADGRGAAAALCLGADGVVMGTRFLATPEARISRGYQNEIVRASDGAASTTRTFLYNQLRGTVGWPKNYSPRTIINQSYRDHQAGVPFEELKRLHDEALQAGDDGWGPEGRLATYAGASIGLIHGVKDADTIVREVREQVLEKFAPVGKSKL
ncbi:putative oxidoreductase 2-nitropropane dioxygenase family [Aspergillus avenaceus]|uniref:Putative oxidoreductase 2-nitropropane dioxygenase family n=1 Tax=Aspergillus avenaceus TaxID=36643 RepID=A0A5N6TZ92_ASPAV|nr:putative oxidoreductase 2-nitropropane dioxygenase family [Aspergillus avenaceus]